MVQGVAVALLGWMLLRAFGRQSSSTRFAVLFTVLVAVAALPFVESRAPGSATALATTMHSAIRLPNSWALDIFILWAGIASAGLLRISIGFYQLRKLRRSCTEIEPASLHPLLRSTLNEFGSTRALTVCISDRVRVPTAIGFWKPAVILPAWALRELSPAELNTILLHELAHLRRWDDWTNLTQKILRALLFFHPAVWWIGKNLSIEREMACDDFVLAATSDPRAYAQCLVSVAEKSFLHRSLALAQAAVSKIQQTSLRVARILEVDRPGATQAWKPALVLVVTFSAVCLIALPRAPRLVGFEEPPVSIVAVSSPAVLPAPAAASARVEAKLIPSAMHHHVRSLTATRPERPDNNRDVPQVSEIPAKFVEPSSATASPRLLRASEEDSVSDANGAGSLVFVVQTEQVDDSGRVVWSVCVWRWTVANPVERQMQRGIPAKSI
jgi:beta-lactamase regulating signal transducer with metallopeptidase domain